MRRDAYEFSHLGECVTGLRVNFHILAGFLEREAIEAYDNE